MVLNAEQLQTIDYLGLDVTCNYKYDLEKIILNILRVFVRMCLVQN